MKIKKKIKEESGEIDNRTIRVLKLGCTIDSENFKLFKEQAWAGRDVSKALHFMEEVLGYYFEDIQELAAPGITHQIALISLLSKKIKEDNVDFDVPWVSQNSIPEYYDKKNNKNKSFVSPAMRDLAEAKKAKELLIKQRNSSKIYKDGLNKIKTLRKDIHREIIYAGRKCHWGTVHDKKKAFESSVKSVIKNRSKGIMSSIRRSNAPLSVSVQMGKGDWSFSKVSIDNNKGQFKLIDRGVGTRSIGHDANGNEIFETFKNRWLAKISIGNNRYIDVHTRFRGWELPEDSQILEVKLVAVPAGYSYRFHLCITVKASWEKNKKITNKGEVALDWGHREEGGNVLSFTWVGSDGDSGEISLTKTRDLIDQADAVRELRSVAFNKIKSSIPGIGKSNSQGKAIWLIRNLGAPTSDQLNWIKAEKELRKRENSLRRHALNIRQELYSKSIQDLKKKYSKFIFEDLNGENLKQMDKKGELSRRKRTNRDLVARYTFERLVGSNNIIKVDPWRTSKNCNNCMETNEFLGSNKTFVCPSCGHIDDRDMNAAKNILLLGQETLGNNKSKYKFNIKKGKVASLRDIVSSTQVSSKTPKALE